MFFIKNSKKIRGIMLSFISCATVGAYFIFVKILLERGLSPIVIALYSNAVSVILIFMVFGLIHELTALFRLSSYKLFIIFIISLLCSGIAPIAVLYGIKMTDLTNAILIERFYSFISAAIAVAYLKEKITKKQIIGSIIMFIGLIIIVLKGSFHVLSVNPGDFLILLASVSYAVSTNLFKKHFSNLHPDIIVFSRYMIGFLIILAVFPFTGEKLIAELNKETIIILILFASIVFLIGKLAFYKALELSRVTTVSLIGLTTPLFGIVYAVTFFHEKIYAYQAAGGILIIIGMAVLELHHSRHKLFHRAHRFKNEYH